MMIVAPVSWLLIVAIETTRSFCDISGGKKGILRASNNTIYIQSILLRYHDDIYAMIRSTYKVGSCCAITANFCYNCHNNTASAYTSFSARLQLLRANHSNVPWRYCSSHLVHVLIRTCTSIYILVYSSRSERGMTWYDRQEEDQPFCVLTARVLLTFHICITPNDHSLRTNPDMANRSPGTVSSFVFFSATCHAAPRAQSVLSFAEKQPPTVHQTSSTNNSTTDRSWGARGLATRNNIN